jgi:hypothetical protein
MPWVLDSSPLVFVGVEVKICVSELDLLSFSMMELYVTRSYDYRIIFYCCNVLSAWRRIQDFA